MPRSTNPKNYEAMYWDLLEAMTQDIPEVKLSLPANKAQKIKYNFYAFIRAIETQGEKDKKAGNLAAAASRKEEANTLRGYLVNIYIDGQTPRAINAQDTRMATLLFIDRDMNPDTVDAHTQVKAQLKNLETLSVPLDGEITMPSVDTFFNKPLEVHDDGDTPSNTEEPST